MENGQHIQGCALASSWGAKVIMDRRRTAFLGKVDLAMVFAFAVVEELG
jgi:hypothetical protein